MECGTLEDLRKTFNGCITDFTEGGKCSGCGNCCSNILPLAESEIKHIKRYMKVHGIKEQKHFLPVSGDVLDMTCPFLNFEGGNKKCVIYPVRPLICKVFKCDDPHGAIEHKELFKEFRCPMSVRDTFFRE